MPNHVINEVVVKGRRLVDVEPLVKGEKDIDFKVLLPPPLNCWQGGSGVETKKAFPVDWYDWNRANWGTKWNAYGFPDNAVREHDGATILTFQTAWSTPRGWVLALFNSLNCDIDVSYLDEGCADGALETFIANCPKSLNGPRWDIATIPEKSPEHRRLHKMLWGVEEFDDEET